MSPFGAAAGVGYGGEDVGGGGVGRTPPMGRGCEPA